MASLEAQPTEILLDILCTFDSTRSLWLAIASSPRLLRIFNQNRSTIITAVLKRAIHPHAFKHAVAAINVPKPDLASAWNFSHREARISSFMRSYLAEDPAVVQCLSSEAVTRLARLQATVSGFMKAYVLDTIPMLSASVDSNLCDREDESYSTQKSKTDCEDTTATTILPVKRSIHLSDTEQARLETSFYRYEIYCKIFDSVHRPENIGSPRMQSKLFMSYISESEAEELACLLQYFVHSLANFFEQIECQLVLDVEDQELLNVIAEESITLPNEDYGLLSNLEDSDLDTFSSGLSHNRLEGMCFLACGGLESLQEMLSSKTKPDRRRELLLRIRESWQYGMLDRALEYARANEAFRDNVSFSSVEPNSFSTDHLAIFKEHDLEFMHKRRYGIRATGYVFWDDSRFDGQLLCSSICEHETIGPFDRYFGSQKRFEPFLEAVEDILANKVISKETFHMLVRKYRATWWSRIRPCFPKGENPDAEVERCIDDNHFGSHGIGSGWNPDRES